MAAQSFHSFSNLAGQGFQTVPNAAEEGVGWRKWAPFMPSPVSPMVQHQRMGRGSDLQCLISNHSEWYQSLRVEMSKKIERYLPTPNWTEQSPLTVILEMCIALSSLYGMSTPTVSLNPQDNPVNGCYHSYSIDRTQGDPEREVVCPRPLALVSDGAKTRIIVSGFKS